LLGSDDVVVNTVVVDKVHVEPERSIMKKRGSQIIHIEPRAGSSRNLTETIELYEED
jgi:hypothetical protein